MESKPPQDPPRKLKYMPKAPPRRPPKPEVKSEKAEDEDATQAMKLMKQFQERSMRAKPKAEKKVQASQIAFGFGAASPSIKSYAAPKVGAAVNHNQGSSVNGGAYSSELGEKEYIEPWNYYSYYPVTLPLRRPYSGNPATLNAEEFGEASDTSEYDENSTNSAINLGLMEENVEANMFFLQLPPTVPMIKRLATADGHKVKEEKTCKLDELPAGHMGKMLVYRSGAVKLKLGDTLYDVSPGLDFAFAQDIAAINTAEKHCCVVAEIDKHAIVTPDVDAIINSMADL
ncbi:DNA binding protein, putative [Ricinus communis]|uniref:DNA binding protein, putative n=1 Tax=Ricinus communis TaxID=3988 RepID=B9RRC4_RICCO|nr:DNA binding protein, putative [Ricinus communis]|eukprot:XP_002516293.1 uncharacterized protein LOC8281193 isoform X1 [Ricinus communis]